MRKIKYIACSMTFFLVGCSMAGSYVKAEAEFPVNPDAHECDWQCYDRILICGNTNEEHVHSEECFERITVCENTDEDHVHDENCWIHQCILAGVMESTDVQEIAEELSFEDDFLSLEEFLAMEESGAVSFSANELADDMAAELFEETGNENPEMIAEEAESEDSKMQEIESEENENSETEESFEADIEETVIFTMNLEETEVESSEMVVSGDLEEESTDFVLEETEEESSAVTFEGAEEENTDTTLDETLVKASENETEQTENNDSENAEEEIAKEETIDSVTESVNIISDLQKRMDAVVSKENLDTLDEEEMEKLREELDEIYELYISLSEEEQAEIEGFDHFNAFYDRAYEIQYGEFVTESFKVYASMAPAPLNSYTLIIPETVSAGSGYSALSGGIQVEGNMEDGKIVTISAESENDWNLVSGDKKVKYDLREKDRENAAVTFLFTAEEINNSTSKDAGVYINPDIYSNAERGYYSDVITFTASMN